MKNIIIILLSLISFNAFAAATSSKSDASTDRAEQINNLYEVAEKRIYNNEYDKALKLLINLAKNDDLGDKKADIYNLLGFSYRKSTNPDLDKSYDSYMIALEHDPQHAGAHEYLGELYMMRGDQENAMSMLAKLENLVGKNAKEYKDLLKAIKSYQS
tara:strand:- start:183 stop:656 length:474 start_codon:yes stop_codon:yes gene_type:complete